MIIERKIHVPQIMTERLTEEVKKSREGYSGTAEEYYAVSHEVEERIRAIIFPQVEEVLLKYIPAEKLQQLATLGRVTPEMMQMVMGIPCIWRDQEGDRFEAVKFNRVKVARIWDGLSKGNLLNWTNGLVEPSIIVREDGTLGKWSEFRDKDTGLEWPRMVSEFGVFHEKFRDYLLRDATEETRRNGHKLGVEYWSEELKKLMPDKRKEEGWVGDHHLVRVLETVLVELCLHRYHAEMGVEMTEDQKVKLEAKLAEEMMKNIDLVCDKQPLLRMAAYNSISRTLVNRMVELRLPLLERAVNNSVSKTREIRNEEKETDLSTLMAQIERRGQELERTPRQITELIYSPSADEVRKLEKVMVSGGIDIYTGEVKEKLVLGNLAKKLAEDLSKPAVRGVVLGVGSEGVELETNRGVPVKLEWESNIGVDYRLAAIEVGGDQVLLYRCLVDRTKADWEHVATLRIYKKSPYDETRVGYEARWSEDKNWQWNGQRMKLKTGAGYVEVLECPIETMRGGKGNVVFNTSNYSPVVINPIDPDKAEKSRLPKPVAAKIKVK